jgi:LuxR family maltose regulon positive regulatory protein
MLSIGAVDSVWMTQLRPTVQRVTLIERRELLQQLTFASNSRLLFVTAPAGYGKTTILSQWYQQLVSQRRKVVWCSIDANVQTLTALVRLLHKGFSDNGLINEKLQQELTDENAVDGLVEAIINGSFEAAEAQYLILDGCERVCEQHFGRLLLPLLRWGPENLKIVMSGRRLPAIEIEDLRYQGQVAELGIASLRFTRREIASFLGGETTPSELDNIERQTLGWPIALRALRSLWRHGQCQLRDALLAQSRELRQYIVEQVLSRQDPELKNFLIELSIIEHLSEKAAAEVLGDSALWQRLMQNAEIAPFLHQRNNATGQFEFHSLLRFTLQWMQCQVPLVRRNALHHLSANWHWSNADLVPAVRHALLAGDEGLAIHFIEAAGGLRIWLSHGLRTLKAVDELITPAMLDQNPRLQLLRAIVWTKQGRAAEARHLFEDTMRKTKNFGFDQCDSEASKTLQYESMVVHSTLLFNQCLIGSVSLITRYAKVLQDSANDDPVLTASVKTANVLMNYQLGNLNEALQMLNELSELRRRGAAPNAEFFDVLHLGAIHLAQGRSVSTDRAFDKAGGFVRRHFPDDNTKRTLLSVLKSDLARETGLWRSAERHLKDIDIRLSKAEAWFDIHASAAEGAAASLFLQGDLNGALETITRMREQMEERGLIGLRRFLDALNILLCITSGKNESARWAVKELGLDIDHIFKLDPASWREREMLLSALTRVALAEGRGASVIEPLIEAVTSCENRSDLRSLTRLLPLLAHALFEQGQLNEASVQLEAALRLSKSTGYIFGFVWDPSISRMLQSAVDDGRIQGELATTALDILARAPKHGVQPQRNGFDALSVREREVLSKLAAGESDKQIARRMDLSENTVKFHLKNVYRKLAVKSRNEAIAYASSLS